MGSLRRLKWNFFVLPFLLFVLLHISSSLTFSDIIQNEEEPPSKDTTIVFGITPPGYKIKVDF